MALHNQKRNYARPRIQRAFLEWFAESRCRFAVPLKIVRRSKYGIDLEFAGAQSMIAASLGSRSLDVHFFWKGEYWDDMLWNDISLKRTGNGYVCNMCEPDERKLYSTREELWRDHMFEVLLRWVNNRLIKSPWIEIYQEEGCTSAMLRESLPDSQGLSGLDKGYQFIDNPMYVASTKTSQA